MDAWQKFLDEIVPGKDTQATIFAKMAEAGLSPVGKTCFYRPTYERETKSAVIVGTDEQISLGGSIVRSVVLSNGDSEDMYSVYFSLSSTA